MKQLVMAGAVAALMTTGAVAQTAVPSLPPGSGSSPSSGAPGAANPAFPGTYPATPGASPVLPTGTTAAPHLAPRPGCPANPGAIGTARTIAVDPTAYQRIGRMQYPMTLPLRPMEVVLTFDDGPLPPYTNRILETLDQHCVKAMFFLVGRMARGFPDMVKRIAREGHTIANHSQNHPLIFPKLTRERGLAEILDGEAAIVNALGDVGTMAPFWRFPGLGRTTAYETFLARRGQMVWSAEVVGDDWLGISGDEVFRRTLSRIEARRGGVVLLHDIQPSTVIALPMLLTALKQRGYSVVHVVAARPGAPALSEVAPGMPVPVVPTVPLADGTPAPVATPATAPATDPMRTPWPRLPDSPPAAGTSPPMPAPVPPAPRAFGLPPAGGVAGITAIAPVAPAPAPATTTAPTALVPTRLLAPEATPRPAR
jgi:peptidoglycan/xylan/chitin deacetylase (PgdA/CDA1 family)